MVRDGRRVRIVAEHSVFFDQTGRVVRSSPEGAIDPAHSVVLDAADGAVPPMTFRPEEVEEVRGAGSGGRR